MITISPRTIMASAALLLFCGQLHAYSGDKASQVAQAISELFSPFESRVAKVYEGKVYLTIPRLAPLVERALVEIVDNNGMRIAIGRLDHVEEKFASARILKSIAPIKPGSGAARGVRLPVRILFIGGPSSNDNTSLLLSDIEEAVRGMESLDLVPPDVAHYLLMRHPEAAPESIPSIELKKIAASTRSDFIIIVSVDDGKSPAVIKLTLLDESGAKLLTETFTWRGEAVNAALR